MAFGTILGSDRRPFKTREGDVIGLESLLDESTAEALKVVKEANDDLDPAEQAQVASVVGLGAIKYADLSQNRISDYVFDWQKMMAKNGNTATYMQYAYARTRNVFRKGGHSAEQIRRNGRRSHSRILPSAGLACGYCGCPRCLNSPPKSISQTY